MPSVVVVGSINIDLVTRVPRLPQPGETVTHGAFSIMQGGKGANQAVAAARLGVRTHLIAAVGSDAFGQAALNTLQTDGVDISHVSIKEAPTGVAQIMVDAQGANLIAVAPGANLALTAEEVADALRTVLEPGAVVLASLEIPQEAAVAAAEVASGQGNRFILNPAPAGVLRPEMLAACAVLVPNEHEVLNLGYSMEALFQDGLQALIVTRGADGADLIRPGREILHQAAFPVEVVDTTGAGDAFSATLAWALADGQSLETALRLAAAGGALATRRLGAREGFASRMEVERLAAVLLRDRPILSELKGDGYGDRMA